MGQWYSYLQVFSHQCSTVEKNKVLKPLARQGWHCTEENTQLQFGPSILQWLPNTFWTLCRCDAQQRSWYSSSAGRFVGTMAEERRKANVLFKSAKMMLLLFWNGPRFYSRSPSKSISSSVFKSLAGMNIPCKSRCSSAFTVARAISWKVFASSRSRKGIFWGSDVTIEDKMMP